MVRQKKLVGQLPMEFLLPETTWEAPTELPFVLNDGDLAIDLETKDDGLAADVGPAWYRRGGFVTGVTVASEHRSIYVPVRHPDTLCLPHDQIGGWLREIMANPGQRKFFHNAPYDLGWMWADWGIPSPAPEDLHDTQAMAFVVDEERMSYRLNDICKWLDVPGKDETILRAAAEAYGYNPKSEMWKLPARYAGPYAAQDGVSTLSAGHKLLAELTRLPPGEKVDLVAAYELERDIIPMVMEMTRRGIRVNTDRAEQTMKSLFARRDAALLGLEDHVQNGRSLSVDELRSKKWMADTFSRLGISYPQTEKGNDSFSNEWMSKYEGVNQDVPHLCARALQLHDAAEKFIGNYILSYTHMGRVHPAIHSYRSDEGGARTSRFSYSDPPLQQTPSRDDEIAIDIRNCLEAEEGEVWAAVDYSQQEYRLIVHFAYVCSILGAEAAVQMYTDDPDTDFHQMVVELTGLKRRRAKDCNFAKAFGAGVAKFAVMAGLSLEEAAEAMGIYDDKVPFVKGVSEYAQKIADERGYVKMIDGFRGHFEQWEPRWLPWKQVEAIRARLKFEGKKQPDLGPCSIEAARARTHDPDHPWFGQKLRRAKTHKALNKIVQGSAARQMKMAMRQAWREGITPLIQMHDELGLSVSADSQGRERAEHLGGIMTSVVKLSVPVKCDIEYGSTWGRAAKDERTGHKPTWENAVRDLKTA